MHLPTDVPDLTPPPYLVLSCTRPYPYHSAEKIGMAEPPLTQTESDIYRAT